MLKQSVAFTSQVARIVVESDSCFRLEVARPNLYAAYKFDIHFRLL
jgi:hypothetical protein